MKNDYKAHFKKMKNNKNLKSYMSTAEKIKKFKTKKSPAPFPVGALMGLIFLVAGSWYGYKHSEKVESIISKVEIRIFGTAIANTSTTSNSANAAKTNTQEGNKGEKKSSSKSPDKDSLDQSESRVTTEELALFKSLEVRKRELDTREAELKKLEEELHKQKVELDKKLSQLDQLRAQIGNQLEERVKTDQEQVDKLVSFYSGMRPQKAAKIIESLNEDLAVEVLRKMKKKEAAEIMNMLEPAKAQRLSERFAGYRK